MITSEIKPSAVAFDPGGVQILSYEDMEKIKDVFEFGSHTHNMHASVDDVPLLVSGDRADILADILQSFESPLTFITGFAYPFGGYSQNACLALQDAGVLFAFTTSEGYLSQNTNPMFIPRFQVTSEWDMSHFMEVIYAGQI